MPILEQDVLTNVKNVARHPFYGIKPECFPSE